MVVVSPLVTSVVVLSVVVVGVVVVLVVDVVEVVLSVVVLEVVVVAGPRMMSETVVVGTSGGTIGIYHAGTHSTAKNYVQH